jgi:hypothetical protein
MQKVILQYGKATFLLAVVFSVFCFMNTAHCQQHIIANKNNTRPETTKEMAARITFFSVASYNGYNEIQWKAMREEETRRYIVEHSSDGVNFQSAGEMLVTDGDYSLKHYTGDTRSLLYRIRIETNGGRFYNTINILQEGNDQPPVKVYPTIIENHMLNAQLYFPVQNVTVISPEGKQIFTKNLGGSSGLVQLTMPQVSKGIYFITFYGEGWKSSEKLLIR